MEATRSVQSLHREKRKHTGINEVFPAKKRAVSASEMNSGDMTKPKKCPLPPPSIWGSELGRSLPLHARADLALPPSKIRAPLVERGGNDVPFPGCQVDSVQGNATKKPRIYLSGTLVPHSTSHCIPPTVLPPSGRCGEGGAGEIDRFLDIYVKSSKPPPLHPSSPGPGDDVYNAAFEAHNRFASPTTPLPVRHFPFSPLAPPKPPSQDATRLDHRAGAVSFEVSVSQDTEPLPPNPPHPSPQSSNQPFCHTAPPTPSLLLALSPSPDIAELCQVEHGERVGTCSHALPPIPGTPNASKPPGDSPAQVTGSISKEARPGDGDLDLSQWLPPEVCAVYAGKGVRCLYPWQAECLRTGSALQGGNLVYSASTSAGKSLVAEILMVRRLLLGSRLLLLVLPYVALCVEKAELMEALLAPLGKRVGHFFGGQGGGSVPPDANLLVCTIEKANSVVNGMLEEGRVGELGMVVVDELHMVGDSGRGYILELMLTKLKYASGAGGTPPPIAKPAPSPKALGDTPGGSSLKSEGLSQASGLQILGMSATMRGGEGVAAWLSASLYTTTFRPVPLHEFIKVGPVLYQLGDGPAGLVERRRVGDEVGELCYEVVRAGHSVLVFCASRVQCETVAKQLATHMPKVDRVHSEEGVEDGVAAVEVLRKRPGGVDATLAQTLPAGVAYHHAGLVAEEREAVEGWFRSGVVRVLTATSTLAAGVNLPARRVIFHSARVGSNVMTATQYRQMAGRAGRAGMDEVGESVLICPPGKEKEMVKLLSSECAPLRSCLAADAHGCKRALLEAVASGAVQSTGDVGRYMRCTLLSAIAEEDKEANKAAVDALRWLCQRQFVQWDNATRLYSSTPLGRAAFGSSLTPQEALCVFADLAKAREGFVLASDLHLLYQITPLHLTALKPDWRVFYDLLLRLPPLDKAVAERVGVEERFLMQMAVGKAGEEEKVRVCTRFYLTLMLASLVQEAPLHQVCAAFCVPRGQLQGLQDASGRFASMVATFCERLGWQDLAALISKFQSRVAFGVRGEIVELMAVPFVKAGRARALYKAGFRTPQALAEATPAELALALESVAGGGRGARMMAGKIRTAARKVVLAKADEARLAAFSAFKALGLPVPADLILASPRTLLEAPVQNRAPAVTGPVDVDKWAGGFDSFWQQWAATEEFYFDFHFNAKGGGGVEGLAVCWQDSPVFYVHLAKVKGRKEERRKRVEERWAVVRRVLEGRGARKVGWELKKQLLVLRQPRILREGVGEMAAASLGGTAVDVRVMAWILQPDEESAQQRTLEKTAKHHLPAQAASAAHLAGTWPPSSGAAARNGCCRRVAQIREVDRKLWKLLPGEGLREPLLDIEMPLLPVLAEMEAGGVGVDLEALAQIRAVVRGEMEAIEEEAQRVGGQPFSLTNSGEVAQVLYEILKLPPPPGSEKGKLHLSTDKQALEALAPLHPLPPLIAEFRRLAKLLHSTLDAIQAAATADGRVHAKWQQTSCSTGRLSVDDPNLQCVERDLSTRGLEAVRICPRSIFVAWQRGWVVLGADYSQIELCFTAHFSADPALCHLLTAGGDLFRNLAAEWEGVPAASVLGAMRERAKRLVYGMLYGMGVAALAEKLECSAEEAAGLRARFVGAYPRVTRWMEEEVGACKKRGYVVTLAGRRRYLDKINDNNRREVAKATRQAVNSVCQGSTADLIKIAMIRLHAHTREGGELWGRCRLLMQIHDELVLEVDPICLRQVAGRVHACMVEAAQLKGNKEGGKREGCCAVV